MKDLLPTLIIILITFINQYIITIINSALFLHLISFGAKKHSKDTKTYLFFLRFFFQRILGFVNKCQHFHSRSLFPSITFFSLKPPIFTPSLSLSRSFVPLYRSLIPSLTPSLSIYPPSLPPLCNSIREFWTISWPHCTVRCPKVGRAQKVVRLKWSI